MFLTWSQGNAWAIDLNTDRLVCLSGVPGAKVGSSNQKVERDERRADMELPARLTKEQQARSEDAKRGFCATKEQKQLRLRADADKLIDLRSRLVEQKEADAERLIERRSRLREKQLKENERLRAEANQLFFSIPELKAFLEAVMLERLVKEQQQDKTSDLGEATNDLRNL